MNEHSNLSPETDIKITSQEPKKIIENEDLEVIGLVNQLKTEPNQQEFQNEKPNNAIDNLFDLNLQNFLNNLTKDDKNTKFRKANEEEEADKFNESLLKNSSQIIIDDNLNESIVDLKDKNFLNKLNYLTKKQRKIDSLGNDCFLNNENERKNKFDDDLEDLIDLYKNKDHKIVLNNIDDDNLSIRISDKSLINNFNLNASKLTITYDNNKEEDSLFDKGNNTILDNTFLEIPKNPILDVNLFSKINVEERAKKFDFEKINDLIVYEDKKIKELNSLSEEYDMQNEEIQGQYLQLMERKKFFPNKDQNLRNFSLVLSMQMFRNPEPTEEIDLKGNFNLAEMFKLSEDFLLGNTSDRLIEAQALAENYKASFNFNKAQIMECFDSNKADKNGDKKRKINSALLSRIKLSDKAKLLKNLVGKKMNYENNEKNIDDIYNKLDINNHKISHMNYNTDNKIKSPEVPVAKPRIINIRINFENAKLKEKLSALLKHNFTKENITSFIEKLFLNDKLIRDKISLWSKKSYNENDDFDYNFLASGEKRNLYENQNKLDIKLFNNYFVSLFEKDKNNNNKNNSSGSGEKNKLKLGENEDYFNLENLIPQIFDSLSLPLEKLIVIIKGKVITKDNLQEIDKSDLEKIRTMKDLELKIDELTEINNFHLFENLNKIYLGGNQLTNLNFLKTLGQNDFGDHMEINQEVNLSSNSNLIKNNDKPNNNNIVPYKNSISKIFIKNTFEKILELNFPQNNIKLIDKACFEKLTNLRHLNLEMNQISKIENLETCKFLTNLNLAYNKIEKLENLDSLINLEKLLMNGNAIKKIENLAKLKKLKHLTLGLNKIKDLENIENEIFYLEDLILYENKLKALPENFSLPFLKSFYLNKNKIKQIPNFFLPNLEEFFLQENKIFSIACDNKLVNYCGKIRKIDLSHNKLENFSEVISFLGYCNNIQVINVNNNPFYVNLNKIINVENSLAKIFKNYKKSDYENLFSNKSNGKNTNINNNNVNSKEYDLQKKITNLLFYNENNNNFDNCLNSNNKENLLSKETSNKLLGGEASYLKEELRNLEDNENPQNIIINQLMNHMLEKEIENEFEKENKINSDENDGNIKEEEFELLFDLLKSNRRKEEKFKKHLDDFFVYFNNQHSNFLNIFTSKFSQMSFFGKNLNFSKDVSFEKYFLLDIFNNQYSKSKNKFLLMLYEILKNKNNNNIDNIDDKNNIGNLENNKNKNLHAAKLIQAKLNENNINEEKFKKYIFNLKSVLEFLSTHSNKIIKNFISRKSKVLKIQNNFRGFKIRNQLNRNIDCFNFLKHTSKILKIQKAFRKNLYRKKFLINFNKLKFEEFEDNNQDDNIQNFFLDDGNIDLQDSFMENLNQNPDKNIKLQMSVIKEEPELKEENEINNKNDEEMKITKKSEKEILDKIKTLEKSIKINQKLESERKSEKQNQNTAEEKKVLYNLNIGLNNKANLVNNFNSNSNNNFIEHKLNPFSNTKHKTNNFNKIESNINVVNMNNIDFKHDPNSNHNELKVVLRSEQSNLLLQNNSSFQNQKSKLPHIPKQINSTNINNHENSLNTNNFTNNNSNSSNSLNQIKLPLISKTTQKKTETPNSILSENSAVKFTSNINISNAKPKREANSLASSNDNFSVKNYSKISNSNRDAVSSYTRAQNNKEDLERSYKSYGKKSDNVYVGGRMLPTKVVEEIRIVEHECREAIKNAKSEWNLQNHLAEELLIKKIKKQYKKKIERLIQSSQG